MEADKGPKELLLFIAKNLVSAKHENISNSTYILD